MIHPFDVFIHTSAFLNIKALILFQITRNKKREVFIEELPETTVQQMGNQGWEGYFP